ncbi:MAG: OPT/YSL family transporter [Candidatus Micrarchaeota archaeon]
MAESKLSYTALALGALLSVIVAAYSAYAGLKVGGLYWPIVTTSLISLAVLGVFGKARKNNVNVMQTAGSSGGLLAGGIIFTIPAAMMLGMQISYMEILVISLVGGILGVLFSYPLRKQLIERENLPCADGTAAAALINAGDRGGRETHALIYSFGAGALFSLARDFLKVLPPYVNLESLKISAGKVFSLGSSISLIPLAGGFLIGWRFTAAWFLGAIFTYFVIIPYALTAALFADKFAVVSGIARPLGVGMVLGSAIMYFILKGLPQMGRLVESYDSRGIGRIAGTSLIVCAGVMAIVLNLDWPLSILAIMGAFAMSYVAGRSTGEMNVDPMEIYAMLVLIAAKLLITQSALPLVILAAIVTIAAGMAGDMMQDLKAGYILGTKLEHQMVAQLVGSLRRHWQSA